MTNAEIQKLLVDAVSLLHQTSVGYTKHPASWYSNKTTAWWQGLDKIAQAVAALDPVAPPSVTVDFTLPSILTGSVSWIVTITGLTPTHVEFYIDGKLLTDESLAPYMFNGDGGKLDSTTLTNASHSFEARAYDSAGKTYSKTVTASVSNTNPPPVLHTSITGIAKQGQTLTAAIS